MIGEIRRSCLAYFQQCEINSFENKSEIEFSPPSTGIAYTPAHHAPRDHFFSVFIWRPFPFCAVIKMIFFSVFICPSICSFKHGEADWTIK